EPKRNAIRQWAKAGIKMIKARINQLHGDSKRTEHFCYRAVRLNVGTKLVAAKKDVAAKERVAFAFEVKLLGKPTYFITALLHPFGKERLFTGALFVAEITGDEFATDSQSRIGGENHVGQSRLWRNQVDFAIQF